MKPTDTTESRRQAVIDAAEEYTGYQCIQNFTVLKAAVADLRHGHDAIAIEQAEMDAAKPEPATFDGLWNEEAQQTPGCWAVITGEPYWITPDGIIRKVVALPRKVVPNTWPIPEAAKAKLRELGPKLDDDEQAEMQSTLSRPDRLDGE